MLHFDQIEVVDFGPFKGRQTITLPKESGVVVVYGENMRGKTSLLNAIRFALFGKVLGRTRLKGSLHQIGNWETALEGKYGFEVTLQFRSKDHSYRLTRSCKAGNNTVPADDSDYATEFYLQRDGDVLGPGEAAVELEKIMPEQVARFFLFDGELLQEYEDLLRSESDMGEQISGAIEKILGVPILTRSRATLRRVLEQLQNTEAKEAQSDQMTNELGKNLSQLQETRKVLQSGMDEMEAQFEKLRTEKAVLEEELRRNQRIAGMMDKRAEIGRSIADIDVSLAAIRVEIGGEMKAGWQHLLNTSASKLSARLSDQERALQQQVTRHEVLAIEQIENAGTCPSCLQPLSEQALRHLREATQGQAVNIDEVRLELRNVQQRIGALQHVTNSSGDGLLRKLWSEMGKLRIKRYTQQDAADEMDRELGDVDRGALRTARSSMEETVAKIAILEEGTKKQADRILENDDNAQKVRIKLESMGVANLEKFREQRSVCQDLLNLFDSAVAEYRERLRTRVEQDATTIFLQLTTEAEYSGLQINKTYGLTILHEDGSSIPVRSAGAEHIVALALVGALQKNAPLSGPIFIDSPFGRLDTEHTRNVVSALPTMTDQVCLLVYEEELQPKLARELLRGQLRAEYTMRRVSARHTELERTGAADVS